MSIEVSPYASPSDRDLGPTVRGKSILRRIVYLLVAVGFHNLLRIVPSGPSPVRGLVMAAVAAWQRWRVRGALYVALNVALAFGKALTKSVNEKQLIEVQPNYNRRHIRVVQHDPSLI